MSIEAMGRAGLGAAALAVGVAACAPASGPVAAGRFSDLRLGRPTASSRQPPPLTAHEGAIGPAPQTSALDLSAVTARVDTYLKSQDFIAEDRGDGVARVIFATRMAEPARLDADAACALQALARPDFSATTLTVRLSPAPSGLTVAVQSSFAEVKTNLVSGVLARESCRSRGVLEREVRRAALGG